MQNVFCSRVGASPEDIEYLECQQEMMKDLYRSYQELDRIIGRHRLVMGRRLFCSHCEIENLYHIGSSYIFNAFLMFLHV